MKKIYLRLLGSKKVMLHYTILLKGAPYVASYVVLKSKGKSKHIFHKAHEKKSDHVFFKCIMKRKKRKKTYNGQFSVSYKCMTLCNT